MQFPWCCYSSLSLYQHAVRIPQNCTGQIQELCTNPKVIFLYICILCDTYTLASHCLTSVNQLLWNCSPCVHVRICVIKVCISVWNALVSYCVQKLVVYRVCINQQFFLVFYVITCIYQKQNHQSVRCTSCYFVWLVLKKYRKLNTVRKCMWYVCVCVCVSECMCMCVCVFGREGSLVFASTALGSAVVVLCPSCL